jgi:phospholipid/cholesterol/gamma-HCH transport system substrate-binding protein
MNSKSKEVRVGVAVILAAVILILGILWIGEFRLNRRWERYTVYFSEVGGLSAGDPVTVSGLEMGKVGSITLEEARVRAELLLEEGIVIRDDSSVEIRSIGLMGERYVYIRPGATGTVLVPGQSIEGEYKAGLPEVVAGVGDIMGEMQSAARTLSKVLESKGDEYNLGESIAKLNTLAGEIITLLKENRDDIRSTTRSMKTISGDLREVVGENKEEIGQSIERFGRAAARLDSVTISLNAIVAGVERGEGSLGMLIKERKLHEELEATLDNLNTLIDDIKEHPQRYITIEIF